jgi:hypothetical protein
MRLALIVAGAAPHIAGVSAWCLGQDLLWERSLSTAAYESAYALASDGSGGLFVAGATGGSLGGPNSGGFDAWVARYTGRGEQVWIRQFGSDPHVGADDSAYALAADGAGGFYIAGMTAGALAGPNAGATDCWLARYSGDGVRQWIVQFGAAGEDAVYALAPDGAGGVWAGGAAGGILAPGESGSAWVARYDSAGVRIQLRQFGMTEWWMVYALAPAGGGEVFAGGAGPNEAGWVARLDATGEQLWVAIRPAWWAYSPATAALCPDGAGGIFATGWAYVHPMVHSGWAARFDSAGNQVWVQDWAGMYFGCAADGAGGIFAGGPGRLARYSAAGERIWSQEVAQEIRALEAVSPGDFVAAGSIQGALRDAVVSRRGCYANCDQSTTPPILNVEDFACFINEFAHAITLPLSQQIEHYANYDPSPGPPVLNVEDFTCFMMKFAQGCP